jgi:hypothetical protein
MSGRPELDLKNFRELRLNLFKKLLHFISVLDQGINQSREEVLHTSKLARDTNRMRLLTIYVEQGWAYGCKVKWEQLWEVETLKKKAEVSMSQGNESSNQAEIWYTFSWEGSISDFGTISSCRSWRLTRVSTTLTRFSGVSRLGFSCCVCSPLLETFSITTYKEGRTIKQDHITKEEEFKERIQTWVMFKASWSKEDGLTPFWTFLVVTLLALTWARGAVAWGTHFRLEANFEELGWQFSMIFDMGGAFLQKRTTGNTGR